MTAASIIAASDKRAAGGLLDVSSLKAITIHVSRRKKKGDKPSLISVDLVEATDAEFVEYMAARLGSFCGDKRLGFRLLLLAAADTEVKT